MLDSFALQPISFFPGSLAAAWVGMGQIGSAGTILKYAAY